MSERVRKKEGKLQYINNVESVPLTVNYARRLHTQTTTTTTYPGISRHSAQITAAHQQRSFTGTNRSKE